MFLETDMLVVVDGDLMLRAEEARGGERRHRALHAHDEALAALHESPRETASSHAGHLSGRQAARVDISVQPKCAITRGRWLVERSERYAYDNSIGP